MPAGSILVADDDAAIRTVLNQALSRAGYEVRSTGNAATLWRWVSQGDGDLVITDVVMPDENAFDLLPRIKKLRPELPVVVMSAQNTFMTAIRASERGAYEYLPKPFDLKELIAIVGRALVGAEGARRATTGKPEDFDSIPLVGRSPAMQEIYRAARAADADRPHGDDLRRVRHRQGTGRARAARLRQAPQRSVRRHQHGGDPARPDRVRIVRPREGRLHRRQHAQRRPLRAGRRRHAVPRRDRRHADGGADAAAARAAAGRIHHRRRPHADQDRCAHHCGDQQGPAHPDPAGPVPRGPVLPPQRGAAAAAAAARAHRGHSRPDPPFLHAGRARGPAAEADRPGRARAAQALSLARQCARAGKPRAPAGRALSAGDYHRAR